MQWLEGLGAQWRGSMSVERSRREGEREASEAEGKFAVKFAVVVKVRNGFRVTPHGLGQSSRRY